MADKVEPDKIRRRQRLVIKVMVWGVVILLAVWGGGRGWVRYQLKRELGALRERGQPTTAAELEAWNRLPAGENYAEEWLAVLGQVQEMKAEMGKLPVGQDARWPRRGEAWPAEMEEAAGAVLAAHAQVFGELERVAGLGSADYPDRVMALTDDLKIPERPVLSQVRRLARLLQLRAVVAARRGEVATVTQTIGQMQMLASTLDREPSQLGWLVSVSVHVLVFNTIELAVNQGTMPEEVLAQWQTLTATEGLRERATKALSGERAAALVTMDRLLGRKMEGPNFFTGWLDYQKITLVRRMNEVVAKMGGEVAAEKEVDLPEKRKRGFLSMLTLMGEMLATGAELGLKTEAQLEVRHHLVRTGLAVLRHQRAKGSWPATLEELAPKYLGEVPGDVQGNGPVKYRQVGEGFIVYGVGHDGQDNGGRERDELGRSGTAGTDVTFTYDVDQDALFAPPAEAVKEPSGRVGGLTTEELWGPAPK